MLTNKITCGIILRRSRERTVGVDCGEGPPVPIPNTEVKLTSAENTWRAAAWEDRKAPTQSPMARFVIRYKSALGFKLNASIAQSVEHAAVNRGVTGSSPV